MTNEDDFLWSPLSPSKSSAESWRGTVLGR
jgi:hypothetical protein